MPANPEGLLPVEQREETVRAIATKVANRCHGNRKVGQAPERYALIWQAARLGALEVLAEQSLARPGMEEAWLREAARHAHDTLIELNPANYSHDDVCEANDAAVEAILTLADVLGETHGKTPEWWAARRVALSQVPSQEGK